MKPTPKAARRSLFAAFALSAAGGAAVAALTMQSTPSATAAPDPCAASEVARTVGSVAMSTGNYLDAHPQTNQTLTTISQSQGGPASLGALKTYFDANPQVAKEMQALQQPLMNLSGKCKLPITIPQLLGLMQAAQSQGGGLPGAVSPALRSPASAITTGTGPLPGPAMTTAG
jgi:heme-binding protein